MYKECLKYPFQVDIIHKKKKSIKKELLQRGDFIEKKIAILGGSTTAEIKDVLELFLLKEGVKPLFYESEYNQYYEDILFENQELTEFKPDIIFIHTTNVNIKHYPVVSDTKDEVLGKLEAELDQFRSVWQEIKNKYGCIIIQNNFELPFTRVLGNLDFSDFHGKTNFIMQLNLAFAEYSQGQQGFYVNDINYLSARFGLEKWHDKTFWYSYKYALSYDAISLLAHNVATIIKAVYGKSKKCLVLDLDNTLWGGVIGDDGANNIKLGKESAVAEAFSAFQGYVKELKERGVILAVCSKNDVALASEGFNHPDSILKLDDFASFKANWEPKHNNLQLIAEEINIGADSLIFVDDNPAEREIVRAQLPNVEVPEMGDDVIKFIEHLDREGYFEPANLSADDIKRAAYYQNNLQRENTKAIFANYGEYLNSLDMKAEISAFTAVYQDRITQLINKTNQFNLTTNRRSAPEVEAISNNLQYITLYGRLVDKFGDNGLVSVMVGSINGDALQLDTWLMSCRVIKREMELVMFDSFVERCILRGLKEILGYYYRTAKNEMVADHYSRLGFELLSKEENGDSVWRYVIPTNYEVKNKFIQVML
jgi:FkbH-like protein